MSEKKDTISFAYEKSKHFRVVHVDGAHGGIVPSGKYLTMNLFNDRRPIPRRQTFKIGGDPAQTLGDPEHTEFRDDDVFREVEICAIMDIEAAYRLHTWLGKRLELYAKMTAEIQKANQSDSQPE